MGARQSAEVTAGLALLRQGVPLRAAAARVGVAPSTLSRAKARAGLEPGKPGRPTQPRPDRG